MQIKSFSNKKLLISAIVVVIFILISFPWRNYVYEKNVRDGKALLLNGKYTSAFVKFEKAKMIKPVSDEASNLKNISKESAEDARNLRKIGDGSDEVIKLIDRADAKICDLEFDRKLITEGKSDIAKINLLFCSENAATYDGLISLGVANIRLSESPDIFKELKSVLRKQAAAAFAKAYEIDPINKTAIEYGVEINKVIGDQKEVDRWQKLLDNLVNIQK